MPHIVLVVDDDVNQRTLYQEELEDEGYTVYAAGDGREALQQAEAHRPDLVVLDVNMPVMDGLDTLSRLLEAHRGVKIVINTAYANYQDSFTAWAADAYVVKKSDLSDLKNAVRRLLSPENAPQ